MLLDPSLGLGQTIAQTLGERKVKLAAAASRDDTQGARAVLSVFAQNQLLAYAKVAESSEALSHEHAVLRALASCPLRVLVTPSPLGWIEWEGLDVLLLTPVRTPGRARRAMGDAEVAGLVELARLGETLRHVLGEAPGLVPVHGDFTPWNCAVLPGGRLSLWDWEKTRLGHPLEDLFHWRAQMLFYLQGGTPNELVAGAETPDHQILEFCSGLQLSPEGAPKALRRYLEASLADPSLATDDAAPKRREALALLSTVVSES
jgi:Phosphotransferase enzyme family